MKLSSQALIAAGLGSVSTPSKANIKRSVSPQSKSLRILILGGTGFTGPFQVKYALSRGHQVTVFNRGLTHPGELPREVEQLVGDRNGQLDALKGRQWDVVIDNPTTLPKWVRDAAQILKGNVDRYVFISTLSVYAEQSWPGMDENGPLAKYEGPDPMKWTVEALRNSTQALYAPLKALSEKETQKWFPGKSLIIRPGLIVGPGDESDRFTYWPVRVARGGEVLAPGDPKKDCVQFIDARDLAEWTIRMVEQGDTGIYNAVGFKEKLLMSQMLDEIKSATHSDAQLTWVNVDFLLEQKIHPWYDLPVWVAPKGPEGGFSNLSNKKALAKGIIFRPVSDTALATLEWLKQQPNQRQANLRAGIAAARESQILAAWHAKRK